MMKCPHCQRQINNVDLVGLTIGNTVFGPMVPGYTAVCPLPDCRAVLGVTAKPQPAMTKESKRR